LRSAVSSILASPYYRKSAGNCPDGIDGSSIVDQKLPV
jgi:hypothetical protein